MTDTIESSDRRPSVIDTHSIDSTRERDFVPLEITHSAEPRSRVRIAAILLALAVRTCASPCTFHIVDGYVSEADVLSSCLYSSLPWTPLLSRRPSRPFHLTYTPLLVIRGLEARTFWLMLRAPQYGPRSRIFGAASPYSWLRSPSSVSAHSCAPCPTA